MTDRPLQGRTAIVTGSGRNIGRAIALAFAREGANVVLNGHRDLQALEAVAREARELGAQALPVVADVGDPDAVQRMVDAAAQHFGGVDVAVSNVSARGCCKKTWFWRCRSVYAWSAQSSSCSRINWSLFLSCSCI